MMRLFSAKPFVDWETICNLGKAFRIYSSADVKIPETNISKTVQSFRKILALWLKIGLLLTKNVPTLITC